MNQVGIVGGGKGGASLLSCMLQTPGIKVLGIADTNLGSPGIQLAKAHGIYHHRFSYLLALPGKRQLSMLQVCLNARALKEMDGDNFR